MIKLIVENGQITGVQCDTPQEAADYSRLMQSNPPSVRSVSAPSKPMFYGNVGITQVNELKDFYKRINKLGHTEVSSGTLANALDVAVQGLGPRLRGIGKKYEEMTHRSFDEVIRREGRPGEESLWHINLEELQHLDF